MENIFIDLEKEIKEYQEEIFDKNFYKENEEEINTVRKLINWYKDVDVAEKIYVGKPRIGFVTNLKEQQDRQEIMNYKRDRFREILKTISIDF